MDSNARIASLSQKLNRTIHDEGLWRELAGALFENGDVEGLRSLFNARRTAFGTAMPFVLSICDDMIEKNDPAFCRDVLRRYPGDCPYLPAITGRLGYVDLLLFDLDSGVANLRKGLLLLKDLVQFIPAEVDALQQTPYLYQWGVSAALFETAAWQPRTSLPMPELLLWRDIPFPPSELACIGISDNRYFPHYVRRWVEGITASMGDAAFPVLTVIEPNDETLAGMEALTWEFPRLRFFVFPWKGGKIPETAISARFFFGNQVLDHLARPTVFLDIDMSFPPDAKDILQTIAAFPLSLQHVKTSYPLLISAASLVGAQPVPMARRFFDDTAHYLLGKLTEDIPLWCCDQVGLFRSVCLARARGDAPTDMTAALKDRCSLPGHFTGTAHVVPGAERFASRTNDAFLGLVDLDAEGRPIWLKETDSHAAALGAHPR